MKQTIRLTLLCLVCFIVLAAPFRSQSLNTDMKLWLLAFAGCLSLSYIIAYEKDKVQKLPSFVKILIVIYSIGLFTSVLAWRHHSIEGLLGVTNYRLGLISLLSCAVIGLTINILEGDKLIRWLYYSGFALAVMSPLYYLFHHTARLGGPIDQPDILAAYLGAIFIIGFTKIRFTKSKFAWIAMQSTLLLAIILTQTRAVLLLIGLWLAYQALAHANQKGRQWLVYLCLGVVLILGISRIGRLNDMRYLKVSTAYRLNLQQEGVRALATMPPWGYGLGNLYGTALFCNNLHYQPLLQTCNEGVGFASTHNILLDRLLETGWLGGIAYMAFFGYCLVIYLRQGQRHIPPVFWAELMLVIYFLTNVTSLELELLFWILGFWLIKHVSDLPTADQTELLTK